MGYKILYNGLTFENNSTDQPISWKTGSNTYQIVPVIDLSHYQKIGNYVSGSTFNLYTGTTAPSTFQSHSSIVTLTGTTLPATYELKSSFNAYTGTTNTRIGTIESNYLTGATNLGAGNGLYTSVSGHKVQLKSLVAGSSITLTPTSTGITISSTASGGGITGATNGLSVSGSKIKLGGTLTGATTLTGSTAHTLTLNFSGLKTTQVNGAGLWLKNQTASANGAQQISPSIVWEGQGWKTLSGGASQSVKFAQYVTPIQGTSNASGSWDLYASLNGGAYSSKLSVNSSGSVSIPGNTLIVGSNLTITASQLTNSVNGIELSGSGIGLNSASESGTINIGNSKTTDINLSTSTGSSISINSPTVNFPSTVVLDVQGSGSQILIPNDGFTTSGDLTIGNSSDGTTLDNGIAFNSNGANSPITITGTQAAYAADYSSNYNARSIIDKNYADSHVMGGTVLPVANGGTGTNTLNFWALHGLSTINIGAQIDVGTGDLQIGANPGASTNSTYADFKYVSSTRKTITLIAIGSTNQNQALFNIESNANVQKISFDVVNGSGLNKELDFDTSTSGILVTDNISAKGLVYALDYSSNYSPRSLVDKGFVTGTTYLSGVTQNIKISTVGKGIYIKEGTNATMGVITLTGGTAIVNTSKVTANSRIHLTVNGGTLTNVGFPYVSARTAGSSFTIKSSNSSDTAQVAWIIIEPA